MPLVLKKYSPTVMKKERVNEYFSIMPPPKWALNVHAAFHDSIDMAFVSGRFRSSTSSISKLLLMGMFMFIKVPRSTKAATAILMSVVIAKSTINGIEASSVKTMLLIIPNL